uniref:Uncharacterized protein n=1 Tax=Siphoviridae sp. ctC4e1 TaxID=2825375 RepID=A0A8S5VHS1_9CAUD|nr:MAG TPA: hypothetical protein [Siphoviridae sp. ctC4e1]
MCIINDHIQYIVASVNVIYNDFLVVVLDRFLVPLISFVFLDKILEVVFSWKIK